jgi:hypothetical protein
LCSVLLPTVAWLLSPTATCARLQLTIFTRSTVTTLSFPT